MGIFKGASGISRLLGETKLQSVPDADNLRYAIVGIYLRRLGLVSVSCTSLTVHRLLCRRAVKIGHHLPPKLSQK